MKRINKNYLQIYNTLTRKKASEIESKKVSRMDGLTRLQTIKRSDLPEIDLDMSPDETEKVINLEEQIPKTKRGRPPKQVDQTTINKENDSDYGLSKIDIKQTNNLTQNTNKETQTKQISKRDKIKKQASAKKSRVKNKLFSMLKLIDKLRRESLPSNIKSSILDTKFSVNRLTALEQRSCFDFFSRLKKEELAIILLMAPNTQVELAFIKEVLLNRKSIDTLFRDFQLENIL